jgi:hypothetical protein
VGYTGVDHLQ